MRYRVLPGALVAINCLLLASTLLADTRTNDIRHARWRWEFTKRAYPLGYIPDQAKERAQAQIRQAQRAHPRTASASGVSARWVNIGPAPITAGQTAPPMPVSGRVTCLAVDPTSPSHWIAGAAQGGVWETRDNGGTWAPKTDDQPSLAMGAVAFAPSNPSIVWAGTGEPNGCDSYPGMGLLKSTDGGNTWQVLGSAYFAKTGLSRIQVNPNDPNYVVVTTAPGTGFWNPPPPPLPANGIYLSTDGGANWSRKLTGPVTALEAAPGNFANQYAATADGDNGSHGAIYRSRDSGNSWAKISGPWTGPAVVRIALAMAPSNPNTVYAAVAKDSTHIGLWRSDNAWNTTPSWVKLPTPSSPLKTDLDQLDYDLAVSVDPTNPDILYFAEVALWKYDGTTWKPIAGHYDSQTQGIKIHPDQHVLVWAGNRLIVCNDGGVWSTLDRGNTFLSHNTTLATIQFYYGSIHPTNPQLALGGEQDNGTSFWHGTNAWQLVGDGDGGDNAISPQHPDTRWLISSQNMSIYRITGGGKYTDFVSDSANGLDTSGALFVAPFAVCPHNENLVISGTISVWRCENMFSNATPQWQQNSEPFSYQNDSDTISALAFAGSDATGNTYAVGTVSGLIHVTAIGGGDGNWIDATAGGNLPGRYISALAFDPEDQNTLYVAYSGFDEGTPGQSGHLFRSRDAMSNYPHWENISPPVNIPHNCLAIDPSNPNTIYVGTDVAVWRTFDGGTTWEHLGPDSGMPNVAVYDLHIHPRTGRVFAFTHGRSALILDPQTVGIAPTIAGFNPTNGPVGTVVIVRGTKLDGTTAVQFNRVSAATFTINSATNLSATVPAGATTGPISVVTSAGIATSANSFTVLRGPAILDFTPKSGNIGTVVQLIGVNFDGTTSISFGGVATTTFTMNSPSQVTVTVPTGAVTGRIKLTTPVGMATSSDSFSVTPAPAITSFSPASGGAGSVIVIMGVNFSGATSVRFNGLPATFSVDGANQITATVPAGAVSGSLQVVTPSGTAVSPNSFTFVPGPIIKSFSPTSGVAGMSIIITGANFSGTTAVKINGLNAAAFTVNSDSQLTAILPNSVSSGAIQVETPGGTTASSQMFSLLPPPPNDNWSSAQPLSGNAGTVSESNVAATKEPGEPDHAGNPGGKSVWYQWTAPATGLWTFTTQGSGFDTLLAVYSGVTWLNLAAVASNDNYQSNTWSSVTFAGTGGLVYWIAVDGHRQTDAELQTAAAAAAGNVVLNWHAAPASPPRLSGFSPNRGLVGTTVTITGTNLLGATSVTFNQVRAVFQVNSDSQLTATVPPGATSGRIGIVTPGGTVTSVGSFTITVPPGNDSFASPQRLSGLSGMVEGSNAGSTFEPNEPNHAGFVGGKSIWYSWTAPTNGVSRFDTRGSTFDTLLAIYIGNSLSTLSLVASNNNSGGLLTSAVTFNAVSGSAYRIAIDGNSGAEGNVVLTWTYLSTAPTITRFVPTAGGPGTQVTITGSNLLSAIAVGFNGVNTPTFSVNSSTQIAATVPSGAASGRLTVMTPNGTVEGPGAFTVTDAIAPNDGFANRIVLTGSTNSVVSANYNCTKEPGEPDHAGNAGGKSVWWSWTAPRSAAYKITTAGSSFDTLLAIYTGTGLTGLKLVDSNDDDPTIYPQSSVVIEATAGVTYQIAVDGYNGDAGRVLLSLFPVTAPKDIYYTGFQYSEGYRSGSPLAGQQGWKSSGSGDNGIVVNYFGDSGQQAYIGKHSSTPGDTLFVWQPLGYTPNTQTLPVVGFATSLAIVDSQNGKYDDFNWAVYNRNENFLFLLNFDNSDMNIYYLLNNTNLYYPTGVTFDNDTIYELTVMMDFGRNRWDAYLDGNPIVTEQPISAITNTLDLADIDASWSQQNHTYGDNKMVFDDYEVWADVSLVPRFEVQPQGQSVTVGNQVVLSAVADSPIGLAYQWRFNGTDMPGATNAILDLGKVNFADAGAYQLLVSNVAGVVTSQAAQLTVDALPNLAPCRPVGWSDKLVVTTSATSTSDIPALQATDEIYVAWAIINSVTNSEITNKFYLGLYVDNVLQKTWYKTGLQGGKYIYVAGYDVGKLSAGTHSITIRGDLTSVIKEQNKNDNTYTRIITVISPAGAPPVLGAAAIVPGNKIAFTINGVQGQVFQVLTSTDLLNWATNTPVTIANPDGTFEFVAPIDRLDKARFYRLQLAPP